MRNGSPMAAVFYLRSTLFYPFRDSVVFRHLRSLT
jgi:hypothetical protein